MEYAELLRNLIETLEMFNLTEDDISYTSCPEDLRLIQVHMRDWKNIPEWRISYEFQKKTGHTLIFQKPNQY